MSNEPLTIRNAAAEIRRGEISPIDLLEQCLARIDRYEPSVRAWVLIDRDGARDQAKRLTGELKRGQDRGPLHGIPIGIKDIIDVFDWPTAAGSKLWANSIARHDAPVVARLRQAGAVILGKTVTTAFASFDPPVTHNPWNLSKTPGGSSSGSAAAVACGMCLGALASQTGGSTTRPAAYCGVASYKPTFGRICTDGVVPLAPSMDHIGVIARSVEDLQVVGGVIEDAKKTTPPPPPFERGGRFDSPPFKGGVRGGDWGRIAVARSPWDKQMSLETRELLESVCKQLGDITVIDLPAACTEANERQYLVMAVEAAAYHESRISRHPEDYPPKVSKLIRDGIDCPASEYARCKDHQGNLAAELDAMMANFDALIMPATIGPAPDVTTTGEPTFISVWSYTGLPTVSLAAGWTEDDLPLAIQVIGRRNCDSDLLAVARGVEEELRFEPKWPPVLAQFG